MTEAAFKERCNGLHCAQKLITMGVTLLARMLLLISSVTLISLLALTRCGLSGAALDNGIMEEGRLTTED